MKNIHLLHATARAVDWLKTALSADLYCLVFNWM